MPGAPDDDAWRGDGLRARDDVPLDDDVPPDDDVPAGPTDLPALQRRLADFAAARHWQPFHTPKNLAVALSVEASELLEIFQWLTPEQAAAVMDDADSAYRVQDEVADVLAYLLQFCEVLGIDPLAALAAKIDRNELRFPRPDEDARPRGHRHQDGDAHPQG